MKKWILTIFSIWFFLSLFLLWENHTMPLGYDHGAYRKLIDTMYAGTEYYSLRSYLQSQFEPFSWVLFYLIRSAVPTSYILTWFYAAIYLGMALWFLFLWKNQNKYTLTSYLGFSLVFFSVVQYKVMWWGFGKELIATFFLLWAMRYNKKILIATIFLSASIALHRLTWFVGLAFFIILLFDKNKVTQKYKWILILSLFLGAFTYFWTWKKHILPFMWWKLQNYIFLKWPYGTLFSEREFWAYESFFLLCGIYGAWKLYFQKRKKYISTWRVGLFLLMGFMVITRSIAHTRLGAFFDMALILLLAQTLPQVFSKKILISIVGIQALIWGYHFHLYHKPGISETELRKIEFLMHYIPKEAKIFSLNPIYMPWLQGSSREILDPSIARNTKKQGYPLTSIMQNKELLCHFMKKSPPNTYLFVGEKERFYPSIQDNWCLNEVIYISAKSRVFIFNENQNK